MAETTASKADNAPVFIPSPESERAEIDAQAKRNRENRKLPVIPGDKVDFKTLQDWLKLLTPEMIPNNRILIYVYRQDPLVNNKMYDSTAYKYIDVISGTAEELRNLDEKYFIKVHGGGKYKLTVNDSTIKGEFKTVFSALLVIDMSEHPPKIQDLRTVLWDHRDNKGYRTWAINNGLIGPDDMPIVPGKENGSVNSDQLVNAMKLVMDFTKQMTSDQEKQLRKQLGAEDQTSKGIQEIILERLRQDDPNKQISTVSQLVTAMKSLMPEKGQSELALVIPLFIQMMQQQADQSNKQFTMMIELMRGNKDGNTNGEGVEKRDEVSRLRDLIEIARELKGGGQNKNQVAEVIDSITPVLTPALQIVANVVALKAAQSGIPAQQIIPQPNKQTVNRQDTIVHPPPQQTQPTQQAQPQGQTMVSEDEATQMINQFKPIILNKLGREGWEFGAWVAEGFGDAVAASLVKYGVEGLLDSAKKVPDFWQHVNATYGEKYLREWLTSLVDYKQIMKKMEQDEDEEEVEFKED